MAHVRQRYRASNGLRVKVDANTATLGRLGLRFGRRIALAGGNIVQPYARLGWTQEFKSTGDVRTNGIGYAGAGRHGRVELGAGVDAALGKGTTSMLRTSTRRATGSTFRGRSTPATATASERAQ